MVKYKPKLNAQIVHEYFSTTQSINDLSEKYYIGSRIGYLNGFKDTDWMALKLSINGVINGILLLISN